MEIIEGRKICVIQRYSEEKRYCIGDVKSKIEKQIDKSGEETDPVVGYVLSNDRDATLYVNDQYKNKLYIFEDFEQLKEELVQNAKWWREWSSKNKY